jgi:hypothetical protein
MSSLAVGLAPGSSAVQSLTKSTTPCGQSSGTRSSRLRPRSGCSPAAWQQHSKLLSLGATLQARHDAGVPNLTECRHQTLPAVDPHAVPGAEGAAMPCMQCCGVELVLLARPTRCCACRYHRVASVLRTASYLPEEHAKAVNVNGLVALVAKQ